MLTCLYYILKGLCYVAFYILPTVIFVGGCVMGVNLGEQKYADKYEDWDKAQCESITYEVTIHWCNGEPDTVIEVRKDLPYTIYGFDYDRRYYGYYSSEGETMITLPSNAYREGYKLTGFYTSEHGGSLVINAAGYGVITLNSDIHIYANWTLVEN